MKEFADDNFKLDENGRKFSKQVENTMGKGEIARSNSVFKRLVLQTFKNQHLFGKKKHLEIIAEKGENAGSQHFILFPQCFYHLKNFSILIFKPLQNKSFWGLLKPVCLSVCVFMYPYKILVIFYCILLQFCCYCIQSLLIH